MVTIGDVARAAGVSRSTVSYALSGNRPISRETRDRIDAAISSLGFTVNAGARALATAQTRIIGLLLRFQEDEFAPSMLQYILAISTAAREAGFDILMVTEQDGVAAVERITSSHMVDGLILLDVEDSDSRLPPLRRARQPGVLIGLPHDADGVDAVDLDFGEAARLIIAHLHERHHREALLVSPPRHVFDRGASYARRFRDAAVLRAAQHGITLRIHHGDIRDTSVDRGLHAALGAHPQVSALVVHNDAVIAALPDVLRARTVTAPRDLSVIGLFSSGFGRTFRLPYTSVETAPDDVGRVAVQQLVHRITTPEGSKPYVSLVTPRIVDRGSTARPGRIGGARPQRHGVGPQAPPPGRNPMSP